MGAPHDLPDDALEALDDFCTTHGLPLTPHKRQQYADYTAALLHFNKGMNLIGPMGAHAVVETLLVDSLVAALAIPPRGHILDVGTGAGLPGIPLKIMYPARPITLVEPRQKRATFLKVAQRRLGLDDVTILHTRIEDVTGSFDTIISKAFQPPETWIATASQFLATDGCILCMTRLELRDRIMRRAHDLGLELSAEAIAPDPTRAVFGFTET